MLKYEVIESDAYSTKVKYYQTSDEINVYKKYVNIDVLEIFIDVLCDDWNGTRNDITSKMTKVDDLPFERKYCVCQMDSCDCDVDLPESEKYSFIENDGYDFINLNFCHILDFYDDKNKQEIFSLLDLESVKNLFYWYHSGGQGYQYGDPGKEWTSVEIKEYQEPLFEVLEG